jgi:uncharacterized protein YbaR (Trm112 family)
MISKELLDILVCPLCKHELQSTETQKENYKLKCVNAECGCIYPIEDDIPVMLLDKAERPCPKCKTQRDWNEEKGILRCPKCNAELIYE